MNATARLCDELRGLDRDCLHDLAERAGVPRLMVTRAGKMRPIKADAHLRIAAALGIDPVTGAKRTPDPCGDIHRPSLAIATHIARNDRNWTLRQAARKIRISYSTIGRIERGEPVSIDSVLAVCKFLNRHPFEFVSPQNVSRQTPTETRSAA